MADAVRCKRTAELADRDGISCIWRMASSDYTVPSAYPSWWEWEGDRKCLAQKPDRKALEVYRNVLRPLFPSTEDAGTVRFDLSGSGDGVLWLSNLVPCLARGKDIWGQAADLLWELPGSRNALGVLEECERAAAGYGRGIAWNEMGIGCGEGGAKPVVIL